MGKGKLNGPQAFDSVERSDKVRELLGERPPAAVRWGTAVITLVFIAILVAVSLIHYPGTDMPIIQYFTISNQ